MAAKEVRRKWFEILATLLQGKSALLEAEETTTSGHVLLDTLRRVCISHTIQQLASFFFFSFFFTFLEDCSSCGLA